jgi:hypothetical protein
MAMRSSWRLSPPAIAWFDAPDFGGLRQQSATSFRNRHETFFDALRSTPKKGGFAAFPKKG